MTMEQGGENSVVLDAVKGLDESEVGARKRKVLVPGACLGGFCNPVRPLIVLPHSGCTVSICFIRV